jgi:envelope integrity protein B
MISVTPVRLGFVAIFVVGAMVAGHDAARAQGPGASVNLAPHIAIYDLKLTSSRGKRALESVRGRIVYDFSGSACDGYALNFRQVTELDSGEGKVALSDLRTATWEEGDGNSFRFQSQNFMDRQRISEVDGKADRAKEDVAIKLTKPEDKKFSAGKVVFPTEHMRLLIEAARAGKTLLEVAVYDGSESGEKIYQSLSVIGRRIAPDAKPDDDAAGKDVLAGLARWPVTISYFDKAAKKADDEPGEQTPIYAITFEMYENGISRSLKLDYGDFVIDGKMSSLEVKPAKACK